MVYSIFSKLKHKQSAQYVQSPVLMKKMLSIHHLERYVATTILCAADAFCNVSRAKCLISENVRFAGTVFAWLLTAANKWLTNTMPTCTISLNTTFFFYSNCLEQILTSWMICATSIPTEKI